MARAEFGKIIYFVPRGAFRILCYFNNSYLFVFAPAVESASADSPSKAGLSYIQHLHYNGFARPWGGSPIMNTKFLQHVGDSLLAISALASSSAFILAFAAGAASPSPLGLTMS